MLKGEVEVVEMMGIERDELGVWGMKDEKLEDVDWIKLVMKLLKLWGSVVGAIETKQGIIMFRKILVVVLLTWE